MSGFLSDLIEKFTGTKVGVEYTYVIKNGGSDLKKGIIDNIHKKKITLSILC